MVCPNCMQQMSQFNNVGGGFARETTYITWELKWCKPCNRFYIEFYSALELPAGYMIAYAENPKARDEAIINLLVERIKND